MYFAEHVVEEQQIASLGGMTQIYEEARVGVMGMLAGMGVAYGYKPHDKWVQPILDGTKKLEVLTKPIATREALLPSWVLLCASGQAGTGCYTLRVGVALVQFHGHVLNGKGSARQLPVSTLQEPEFVSLTQIPAGWWEGGREELPKSFSGRHLFYACRLGRVVKLPAPIVVPSAPGSCSLFKVPVGAVRAGGIRLGCE